MRHVLRHIVFLHVICDFVQPSLVPPPNIHTDVIKICEVESFTVADRVADLPVLQHLLTPRLRGLQLTLDKLRPRTDAIYDVTVAFNNTNNVATTKQRLIAPGLIGALYVHVRHRFGISSSFCVSCKA